MNAESWGVAGWFPQRADLTIFAIKPTSFTAGNLASITGTGDYEDAGIPKTEVPQLSANNDFTGNNTFSSVITDLIQGESTVDEITVAGLDIVGGTIDAVNGINSNFETRAEAIPLNAFAAPVSTFSLNNQQTQNVPTPLAADAIANRGYVDAQTFLSPSDTPNSYAGEAAKMARVNGAEDGLEFSDDYVNRSSAQSVSGIKTFSDPTNMYSPRVDQAYGNLAGDSFYHTALVELTVAGGGSVTLGNRTYTTTVGSESIVTMVFDLTVDDNGEYSSLPEAGGFGTTYDMTVAGDITNFITEINNLPPGSFVVILAERNNWATVAAKSTQALLNTIWAKKLQKLFSVLTSASLTGGLYVGGFMNYPTAPVAEFYDETLDAVRQSFFIGMNSVIAPDSFSSGMLNPITGLPMMVSDENGNILLRGNQGEAPDPTRALEIRGTIYASNYQNLPPGAAINSFEGLTDTFFDVSENANALVRVDPSGTALIPFDGDTSYEAAGSSATVQGNLDAHTQNTNIHTPLNDGQTTTGNLWSANRIQQGLDGKLDASEVGVSVAPLVGGVVPQSYIPAIALTNVFVVASEAAMLALTAETGDVAKRTDTGQSLMLSAEPASTLGNWVVIAEPGGGVQTVNGDAGPNVVLTTTSIAEGTQLYYTDARVNANGNVVANTNHRNATGNPHGATTTDIAEGTQLYYTEARVNANANVVANTNHRNATGNPHGATTSDISEGSNLYFTDGRVAAAPAVTANTTHAGTTGNPHSTTFSNLGETPAALAGNALKGLRVNSGATSIEYYDAPDEFDLLEDTPDDYAKTTDATTGKSVVAQSSGTGSNAIDDNTGTNWAAASTTNEFIVVDMGSPIACIKASIRSNFGSVKDFQIRASATGAFAGEEVTLFSGTHSGVSNQVDTYVWSNATAYRYYQLLVVDTYPVHNVLVQEFELFESAAGQAAVVNAAGDGIDFASILATGIFRNVLLYNTSGAKPTFTIPTDEVLVLAKGGGGGGGHAASSNPWPSGGGGSGGFCAYLLKDQSGLDMTITVGAGGAGSTTQSVAGATGGATQLQVDADANKTITCNGGAGGNTSGTPGNGGVVISLPSPIDNAGELLAAVDGEQGLVSGVSGQGPKGGAGILGQGGRGNTINSGGVGSYGGGGGGSANFGGPWSGGNGGSGFVIILW